jgi:SAM-dependent methyltransferase
MARYDGVADWYDAYVSPTGAAAPFTALADGLTRSLLGPGSGRCLEVACGGGNRLALLTALGWSVVGVDVSADQLRLARDRAAACGAGLARADAGRLPVATASCDAAVSVMAITDLPDLAGALREMRRVLRPGGRCVVVGPHPCFSMAFVSRSEDGAVTVHDGYRRHAWLEDGPLLGDGIRRRVGTANVPLPALLNAVTDAGLVLERTAEDDGPDTAPQLLGLRAVAPAAAS